MRIITELRDHTQFEPQIRAVLRATSGPSVLLLASNLGELVQDLRLPVERRLTLLLELEGNEDPDDWRPKFWTDSDASDRFISPFARAAAHAVRADPSASIRLLVDRLQAPLARLDVCHGLLVEAGAIDPETALEATWPHRDGPHDAIFADLAYLHPREAARQALGASQAASALEADVAPFLWTLAMRHRNSDGESSISNDLGHAAAELLPMAANRRDAALLKLVISRARPLDAAAQEDLTGYWDEFVGYEVWQVVAACPVNRDRLLDKVFTEVGAGGPRDHALTSVGREVPWEPLVARLEAASHVGSRQALPIIAETVEMLLYRDEADDRRDARLRAAARTLASSPIGRTRLPILYLAGSPMRVAHPPDDQVAFRDELLQTLVEREDGGTLQVLVWKLCQSALERGGAAERLLILCRRFGTRKLEAHLHHATLMVAGSQRIVDELQMLLARQGLPTLPDLPDED